MSKARPDLSNSVEAARDFVAWLGRTSVVQSVWLAGSRSPLRKRQPTEDSDWDFMVVSDATNLKIPLPRSRGLHGDLLIMKHTPLPVQKAVMLWPNDTHGMLNGI